MSDIEEAAHEAAIELILRPEYSVDWLLEEIMQPRGLSGDDLEDVERVLSENLVTAAMALRGIIPTKGDTQ